MDEHIAAEPDLLPGELFIFSSAMAVQLDLGQNIKSKIVSNIVPKSANSYAPTRLKPNNLALKIRVHIMGIQNVLHPAVIKGKLFFVLCVHQYTMRVPEVDHKTGLGIKALA